MKNIRPWAVLLLALVLGLAAAAYAATWLKQQGAANTLQVVVALRDVPMGTRLQPDMLTTQAWPRTATLQGALTSLDQALDHIRIHGSGHSESILTSDERNAERFLNEVDAAAVYVNASTAFTDGGEFGMGAEIGISTQKLHARGPMGLAALTSSKWMVRGDYSVR